MVVGCPETRTSCKKLLENCDWCCKDVKGTNGSDSVGTSSLRSVRLVTGGVRARYRQSEHSSDGTGVARPGPHGPSQAALSVSSRPDYRQHHPTLPVNQVARQNWLFFCYRNLPSSEKKDWWCGFCSLNVLSGINDCRAEFQEIIRSAARDWTPDCALYRLLLGHTM